MPTTISGSTGVTYPSGGVANTAGAGVGTTDTQTLTNKTMTSPTLTTPNIDSAQFATVSGTAPIYPCRAWVSFNGTGTVAILASGNVSSITDSATGKYIVNFTTAMTDANYSSQANCAKNDPTNDGQIRAQVGGASTSLQTASACSYISIQNTTLVDTSLNMAAFFR